MRCTIMGYVLLWEYLIHTEGDEKGTSARHANIRQCAVQIVIGENLNNLYILSKNGHCTFNCAKNQDAHTAVGKK